MDEVARGNDCCVAWRGVADLDGRPVRMDRLFDKMSARLDSINRHGHGDGH